MLALHFDGKLELKNVEVPLPANGEALIGVNIAGICRTDIEITRGYMQFSGVPGHEFVGTVLECESAPHTIGKRVAGEINIAPGIADDFERRHHPKRSVLGILGKDGCFAGKITLPVENLHIIPEGIPDRTAVFIEPLAAALEILEQVQVRPESQVAVLGDGKLGLLAAQVLRLPGCNVAVIGKHKNKLAIAGSFGAEAIHLNDLGTRRFDIVIDSTGRAQGIKTALSMTKPRGTLVLKTTTATPPDFHTASLVIDEITIVGSRCGPFAPAIRLLDGGQVNVEPLIDSVFPLNQGIVAFERAGTPGVLKVLLDIGGD